MNKQRVQFLIIIIVLISMSLACGLDLGGTDADATVSAMSTAILETATAAAAEDDDSSSGEASSSSLQTAQAEATQKADSVAATQTLIAESQSEENVAQATIAAPVLSELPLYNVDPDKGQLGWVHDPVVLEVEGYQQNDFANDFMQIIAADFAMAADITWETEYGTSGCGFMLRSDGNKNKPNQYIIAMSRAGLGHAIFMALADGELANYKDFYIRAEDKSFGHLSGDTNRLVVVGRGHIFEIYINGVKIGDVDTTEPPQQPTRPSKPQPPADPDDTNAYAAYEAQLREYQDMLEQMENNFETASLNFEEKEAIFDEGFVAMIAISESGLTRCEFSDAWLWLINE
jgi:hypothetical protein